MQTESTPRRPKPLQPMFVGHHLSRRSFDRVHAAEKRRARQQRRALRAALEYRLTPEARALILKELATTPVEPAALARTVRIGREAFDSAMSARQRGAA